MGTNRRFIVSNRPGARVLLEAAYDDYAMRGESENRNKELKRDLAMDRLSDHRFKANYFRLYLHAQALNLLVRLRREVAAPPPGPAEAPGPELKRHPAPAAPTPRNQQQRDARFSLRDSKGRFQAWRAAGRKAGHA